MKNIAENVNKLRKERGLTWKAFLRLTGISKDTICYWRKNTHEIRVTTLGVIAEKLNSTMHELLGLSNPEPENTKRFHRILREKRKELCLTQAELAKMAGVVSGSISNYERNSSYPTVECVQRLADALGIATSELIGAGFGVASIYR